jgi:hypothetical protein
VALAKIYAKDCYNQAKNYLIFNVSAFKTSQKKLRSLNLISSQDVRYSKKYCHSMASENLRELDLLPDTVKNNVIKSLIVLSKFLG